MKAGPPVIAGGGVNKEIEAAHSTKALLKTGVSITINPNSKFRGVFDFIQCRGC